MKINKNKHENNCIEVKFYFNVYAIYLFNYYINYPMFYTLALLTNKRFDCPINFKPINIYVTSKKNKFKRLGFTYTCKNCPIDFKPMKIVVTL